MEDSRGIGCVNGDYGSQDVNHSNMRWWGILHRRIINCNINREIKFSTAITGVSSPNCGDKIEVQLLFMATLWG